MNHFLYNFIKSKCCFLILFLVYQPFIKHFKTTQKDFHSFYLINFMN
jgi:hypothetical protein